MRVYIGLRDALCEVDENEAVVTKIGEEDGACCEFHHAAPTVHLYSLTALLSTQATHHLGG